MRRARSIALLVIMLAAMTAAGASAQTAAAAPSEGTAADRSRLWLVAGTAFTTFRGDCQECEVASPYRHTESFSGAIGRRITPRMDAGVEVLWVPANSDTGGIRATFVMAAAQFRPWASRGFLLKVGMGMTLVRNWVYDGSGVQPPVRSKALGLGYGAGWVFRPHARAGLQVLGTQHVAALGDFQTATGPVENVVGNFWSVGAAVVIR
jgi:hypothetical protein